MENVRRVISVLVENESSVLSRISGLFAGRGYNIETLTVAPVPDSNLSHITIATILPLLPRVINVCWSRLPNSCINWFLSIK